MQAHTKQFKTTEIKERKEKKIQGVIFDHTQRKKNFVYTNYFTTNHLISRILDNKLFAATAFITNLTDNF